MQQDTHKTKVIFLLESGNGPIKTPFAFFPEDHFYHDQHPEYSKVFTSYAHIGQHSACHLAYAKKCKPATMDQYADLARELIVECGYNLDILNDQLVTA